MTPGRAGSDGWLPRWARRDRRELAILLGGVAALLLVVAFFVLAAKVIDGDTQSFDARVLWSLRRADDPSTPIGPAWLRAGALDITALGSPTVLGLVTLAICGFLLLQRMARTAVVRIRRDHRRMGREQRSQGVCSSVPGRKWCRTSAT